MQTKSAKNKLISVILLLLVVLGGGIGYKFIAHERDQNQRIENLSGRLLLLEAELNASNVEWPDDTYNYLAVGNSITIHPLTEYWWNENGMAATTAENDFVHHLSGLIGSALETDVTSFAYNFAAWELTGHDRGETLHLLNGYLDDSLDLVTIQLSDNANDLTTFESDFEELIAYVKKRASGAEIIVVGDFWNQSRKDEMKKSACEKNGVIFISLDEIKNRDEYKCGLGTTVYDAEGRGHAVKHEGVADHPNDKAMEWIAERIFENM